MNNMLCGIFGHNWKSGWAGAFGGPFGAVVVNYKTCERCDKKEHEYTTKVNIEGFKYDYGELLRQSREFTPEESKMHSELLKKQSTAGRKLYDV